MGKRRNRQNRHRQDQAALKAQLKQDLLRFDPSTELDPGKTVPVSAVLIVKDCAASLRRTLQSLRKNFLRPTDELLCVDTGSTDNGATAAVVREFGGRLVERPDLCQDIRPYVEKWIPEVLETFEKSPLTKGCLLNFAQARQVGADEAAHDIQFWIDSDDELVEKNPGQFRALIDRVYLEGRSDTIFLDYLYAFDAHDGATTTTLKRERVYDRRIYHWKGRCHETAIPKPGVLPRPAAYFSDLETRIVHHKDRANNRLADIRNYVIIRREVESDGDKPDPRSIFYLANSARGLGRFPECIDLYQRLLDVSGSRDDRFAAAYYVAYVYLHESIRRPLDAIDWFFKCVRLKPEDPRGPFGLARAYFFLQKYHESVHWFQVGKLLPEPAYSLHSYDPTHVTVLPYQLAALAYQELDQAADACACVDEATRRRPTHPDTKALQAHIANWMAGRKLVESVQRVLANSGARDQKQILAKGRLLVSQLASVPSELEEMGLAKPEPPDERAGPDLTIYCGKAIEEWGPKSDGLGGSEKSVIQMAKRLQKRGLRVSVYTNVPPDQRGIDSDGVNWQHYGSLDYSRPRDTLLCWRSPELLELPIPAKRRILWCHDVQDPRRWTDARVQLVDEVWVLSEFHKTTLGPWLPKLESKVRVTRNGVDAALFKRLLADPALVRNPKKIIYASSPDRGVLTAMRIFRRAKELYPEDLRDAELHIFYGFTKLFFQFARDHEYRYVPDVNRDVNLYEYAQAVNLFADREEGIKWRGRIGWEQMAKEFCTGGVWLYPTRFDEISCMAAMEAQAGGCLSLVTRKAALAETVHMDPGAAPISGDDIDGAAKALARLVGHPTPSGLREYLSDWACQRFDYETLADEWAQLLTPVVHETVA